MSNRSPHRVGPRPVNSGRMNRCGGNATTLSGQPPCRSRRRRSLVADAANPSRAAIRAVAAAPLVKLVPPTPPTVPPRCSSRPTVKQHRPAARAISFCSLLGCQTAHIINRIALFHGKTNGPLPVWRPGRSLTNVLPGNRPCEIPSPAVSKPYFPDGRSEVQWRLALEAITGYFLVQARKSLVPYIVSTNVHIAPHVRKRREPPATTATSSAWVWACHGSGRSSRKDCSTSAGARHG